MENHLSERLIAGCLPVPLFNQKKRNRLPLTSNPAKNELVFGSEFPYSRSLALPSLSSDLGNAGYSGVHIPGSTIPAVQKSHWIRQEFPKKRPPEIPPVRGLAPIPHPGWPVGMGSQGGKQILAPWQDCSGPSSTKLTSFPNSGSIESRWKFSHSCLQTDQQSNKLLNLPVSPCSQIPGTHTATLSSQQQNSERRPTSTLQSSQVKGEHTNILPNKITPWPQKPARSQMKPATDNSLRILTAVIEGMKHWSQFKDRAPFLFEVFGTLDSAVTIGNHGAKTFLLRDGQYAVQCVFYETDQDLPRLIRGQVHRCMGNYDRGRELLTCMCVRHASSSEQRNAQEAVKASDAQMRRLLRSFSEV
ncbi:spermatogenesis-associated protein 22 [Paramormyrops kingsleyae]|uniref:spermatogenesis-associated protein 22 n=1 Tax=Paramormyrops kingsleyae TaxID=1676925 RepID=UPI003B96DB41